MNSVAHMAPQYSMYGHIRQLAEAEKKGIEKAGGTADLFQYVWSHTPHGKASGEGTAHG